MNQSSKSLTVLILDSSQPCYPGVSRTPTVTIPATSLKDQIQAGVNGRENITAHTLYQLGWTGHSGTCEFKGKPVVFPLVG